LLILSYPPFIKRIIDESIILGFAIDYNSDELHPEIIHVQNQLHVSTRQQPTLQRAAGHEDASYRNRKDSNTTAQSSSWISHTLSSL
jgi:hypothetical protein